MVESDYDRSEFIKKVAPKLKLLNFSEDSILIQDSKTVKDKLAVIKIVNGKLFCDLDETDDCTHIHFTLTLPELVRIKNKLKEI